MFDSFSTEIEQFISSARYHLDDIAIILGILWLVNILNWATHRRIIDQGVQPRTPQGILGIFLAPIIHSGFNHLFFNSIPLFVLGLFILSGGTLLFAKVSGIIILLSGLMLWLLGRK